MTIEKLKRRKNIDASRKLVKAYNKMQKLIDALNKKELSSEVIGHVNEHINLVNSFRGIEKDLIKNLKKSYSKILQFVVEKQTFVTRHHYRILWMGYGMLAGLVFSTVFTSIDFMGIGGSTGIGLSMGMLIGIVFGTNLDLKAEKEGRQLELIA
jgi:amino acid permease